MLSHLMHGAYSILFVMVGNRIHVIHRLVVTPFLQQREEPHEGGAVPPPPHTRHYTRQHKRKMH